ncbi:MULTISPECIES: L-cystine transporter [unclassified Adlercreutzia]|uniref:L-cystine transporter n=1 Tax=unclassified Adlercreutzia TaxID=2636013 RepID=UPI0013ED469B|nr:MULTISPECIES: cation:dicarboxylase symporter family transporter [unclassified Adlercreutzia]
MSEAVLPAVVTLVIFVALLLGLKFLNMKGKSFTFRVFTALGAGIVLGIGMQMVLGRGTEAAKIALDWMAIVGTGYVSLLKMLVMPLVFVSIVGAFTRSGVTNQFGKISGIVLAVLMVTVAIAGLIGWGSVVAFDLAGASFTQAADAGKMATLEAGAAKTEALTIPQEILSFIPTNFFADLAGTRDTSTIAVVIFAAFLGVAYLKLRGLDTEDSNRQADFFANFIDALYGIVMRVVRIVIGLTPYGVLALIAKVLATSDYVAILDLSKFVIASYVALLLVLVVHSLVLLGNRVNPLTYFRKVAGVLGFAFVSRTSAGALPLNIETQQRALGVDAASANLSGSFGLSIGQNGCAGIYPAMLATIIAPTVGINVLDPSFVIMLVAVVVISSFGVAGVGGGATFASLIVLGTMGLPIEISAILASVEPLIDMGRTAVNVSDAMVAGVTASNVTGQLDRKVLEDKTAVVSSDFLDNKKAA